MIGPDHYRRAEDLLRDLIVRGDYRADDVTVGNTLALAQVHATLALASATALAIDPTPDAVALWDDLVLDEDAIVEEDDLCLSLALVDSDVDDAAELGATGHPGSSGG